MSRFFAMEEKELEKIISLHNDLEKIKAEASRKEIHEITAILQSEIENMGSLFEIKDGIAHIPIVGALSEKPALSGAIMGSDQTTYGSIIDNIEKAENDPMVSKAVFEIDTPGGNISGLDQTGMRIKAMKISTESHVHNMAASAGFWLASQTDKIIAMTPTAEIGSIGVAAEIVDFSEQDKTRGIKRHVIVSEGAEDKRSDISTKPGRDKLKARLTDTHNIFVQRVAEGRGVSEETVREDFGKGGVLIASKALEAGMIDGIMDGGKLITAKAKKKENPKTAIEIIDDIIATEPAEGAGINNEEVSNMTKEELKTQNPGLYDEIFSEGKQAGIEKERDQVKAHLTMGKAARSIETAIKHIEAGDPMSQTVNAEYMAAGMNKNDLGDRKAEDDKLGDLETSDLEESGDLIFAQELSNNLGHAQEVV